jgi:hypothetical protein
MTTQVIAVNERAIAVSSDSAETVRAGEGRERTQEVEKIMPLGEQHRVVVASSDSAYFMEVPIEVLVGEWARTLHTPFPKVSDYADALMQWIAERHDLMPKDVQRRYIKTRFLDYIHAEPQRSDSLDDGWLELEHRIAAAESSTPLQWGEPGSAGDFLAGFRDWAEPELERVWPTLGEAEIARLTEDLPKALLTRTGTLWGVARLWIAGYGNEQFYPAACEIVLGGVLNGMVVGWVKESKEYERDAAHIVTVAQSNAIHTLLRGLAFTVRDLVRDRYGTWQQGLADLVPGPADEDDLAAVEYALEEADRRMEELSQNEYVGPLMRTVEAMSGYDLGVLARSLVEIQVLRAMGTPGLPTVGGAVSTVVISRAGGLRWLQ